MLNRMPYFVSCHDNTGQCTPFELILGQAYRSVLRVVMITVFGNLDFDVINVEKYLHVVVLEKFVEVWRFYV